MRTSVTIHNMDARNGSGLPVWNLADRLRKIRRDAHLTQDQIAHELGIKTVTWSAWEAGRNRPDDVIQLATALETRYGVPAAWTLGVLPGAHVEVPAQREYGRRATDNPDRASLLRQEWFRQQERHLTGRRATA